jgi:putative ABC transport system permease protein
LTRLLARASSRFYLRHPWQLALAIAGISLGVAVYVGVRLANDGAARAFDLAVERMRGAATHRLLPLESTLDEKVYRDLVLLHGIAAAWPIADGEVGFATRPQLRVPLVGVDPLGQRTAGLGQPLPSVENPLLALIVEPNTVLMPATLGAELGVGEDDSLSLSVGEREASVRVLGLYPDDAALGAEPPILADIATAQELLGSVGRISRIDMALRGAEASALSDETPAGTLLVATETERSSLRELTSAFRTNLTALGLLALVVGTFLIYGTMAFAILQRTQTLGILRAIGVSRAEIMWLVAFEAAIVGAIATILGVALGHVLAIGLIDVVLRTIGDLSFGRAVLGAEPSPWIYVQGAALGLCATLLAAAKPALDAARTAPAAALRRAVLERRSHVAARRAAYAAVPVLAFSALLLAYGPDDLPVAFAGLFGVLAAGALVTPLAGVLLMAVLNRILGRRIGIAVRLAIRGVGASLSRTGVAMAALAIAVATVNGVGVMIESFRQSLSGWLDTTLTADIYIGALGDDARLIDLVDSDALLAIEGIAGLSLTRTRTLSTPQGEVTLRAARPGTRGWGLDLVAGDAAHALSELAAGRGVVASERLLFARGVGVGAEVQLPAPTGIERLPIVGAFRDFNTGVPAVVVALETYRSKWGDPEIDGIGVDLAEDADASAIEDAVRRLVTQRGNRRVRSAAGIEELSLAVFDRTFEVTEVLRLLAAIVAFLGILSALLAIELERTRELSVLRTLGFTPRGLAATLLTQTGLLGLAAGLAAIPIGTALAALLVYVINRRSFGWSMELVVTAGSVTSGLTLALAAALLAGVYPAWRASRVELATGLRED